MRETAVTRSRAVSAGVEASTREPAAHHALRWLLVAAQATTLWITWPVWQSRTYPPALPLLSLPNVDLGIPLLVCLALVGLRPGIGTTAYAAVLAWSIAADQMRLQPYMVSLLLFTCGTLGHPAGTLAARATLVATWLYAGLHKLTSAGFFADTAPWLVAGLFPGLPPSWAVPIGAVLAVGEVLLALSCLVPRCRMAAAVVGAVAHGAVLAALSPLGLDWNPAVWPWNAALVVVVPVLLSRWTGAGFGDAWTAATPWARGVAVALMIGPAGYWFGVTDASLAHCLYAGNVPRAFVCTPFSRVDINSRLADLNVFVPPAQRLFDPLFLGVGRAGEWMEVEDPRWIAAHRGHSRRTVRWSDLVPSPHDGPSRLSPRAGE